MRLPVVVASSFAAGLLVGALGAGAIVHPEWFGLAVAPAAPETAPAARPRADENAGRREEDARRQAEEATARRRDEEARRPAGHVSCDHAVPALRGAFANEGDCTHVRRALTLTLTTARDGAAASTWNNARSGVSGTVRVFYTTQESDGTMCRRFQQSVTRDGKETSGVATACYRDNAWQIAG